MSRTGVPSGFGIGMALALCTLGPFIPSAFAQTARQILVEYEDRNRSKSQEHTGEVVVTTKNGTERRKTWRSYREGSGNTANRLIRFVAPPEVRDVGFLSRSRPGKSPDQWIYLPSMKRERRIASQDRATPFVGTDFNYEDMEEFDQTRYEPTRLPDQTIDGHLCYRLQLVPTDRSAYEKLVIVMRKDNLWVLGTDYFVKGDSAPWKQLVLSDFVEVDGHWVARQLVMTDRRKGSRTTVSLVWVVFDRPQPPDRFTLKNLVREGGDDAVGMAQPADPRRGWRDASDVRRGGRFLSQAPSTPAAPGVRGLTGYLDGTVLGYVRDGTDRDPRGTFWGTAFVKQTARIGSTRVVVSARAELISSSERGPLTFDAADRQIRRSPLSLRELSALVPLGAVADVQVGRFVIDWSTIDAFSPADAFLPRDASDLFAPEKLPLWGARLQAERGAYRAELYGSFVTTPWRLPRMDGHYSPFAFADVYLLDARSPPPIRGFEGARVRRTGSTWDVGLWARTGIRPAPILSGDLGAAMSEGERRYVEVNRRFAREDGIGLQVSREVAQWILRGEMSYLRSPDPDLNDAALWALEAQRSFRNGVLTASAAGNALAAPEASVLYFDRAFLPGVSVGTQQQEPWGSWALSWFCTIDKVGGLLKAEVARNLNDTVKLTVGADLPDGARLESPGAFARAQRVRASLRWNW